MRSEGYCSWVGLSVCLSVNRNLSSGASVRPEKDITYSTGNEGQNICVDFSEAAPARMRSEGYCSWVGLSVCLSVNRNLSSGASVRPEKDITYSTGNEGQNICVDFSEAAPLQRYTASSIVWVSAALSAILETAHAHY